jgi:hypothetical protein
MKPKQATTHQMLPALATFRQLLLALKITSHDQFMLKITRFDAHPRSCKENCRFACIVDFSDMEPPAKKGFSNLSDICKLC